MKKVLLVLGVAATLGLVACDPKSDCDCTVGYDGNDVVVPVLEFDGECDKIAATDLPTEWQDIEESGGTFACVEK